MPPMLTPRSLACVASAPKSSTRSHGMCSDTRGASPVAALTCAASEIFSTGVRGVPGVLNTLNRVPELPYAQLGTSTVNSSRPLRARSTSSRVAVMWRPFPVSRSARAPVAAGGEAVEERGEDQHDPEGEQLELGPVVALEGEQD